MLRPSPLLLPKTTQVHAVSISHPASWPVPGHPYLDLTEGELLHFQRGIHDEKPDFTADRDP